MRILYDGAIYSLQAFGGISRYFSDIISRLAPSYTPILLSAKRRSFPLHPNIQIHCREFSWWPRPFKKFNRIAKQRYFDRLHSSVRADVLHPTYYSLLSTIPAVRKRSPIVITVHDCIHERFADQVDLDGARAREKREAIGLADRFICVSESTKRDLMEFYRIAESKITVIYHATGFGEVTPSDSIQIADRPYFLFVGGRSSYKNFDRLLDAIAHTRSNHPDVLLYVVGEPFSPTERCRIEGLGIGSHVVNRGSVSDSELKRLYQESVALVYPSIFEGFGIPPLEAMVSGTAVVAANTSSLPEVVGNAGFLFPPESTRDLTEILDTLLDNPSVRQEMIAKGRQQAAKFSWSRAVKEHMGVYERAART